MKKYLTFDDVLIKPKFSTIESRADVDLSLKLGKIDLTLPVLSANMDTVTEVNMAKAMHQHGGLGVLHRFGSIDQSVNMYKETTEFGRDCAVSVGIGEVEKARAQALYEAGARLFVLDVAHGAQSQVVNQYRFLKENLIDSFVIVGNFASAESCNKFWAELNSGGIPFFTRNKGKAKEEKVYYGVDAFKIGVGPGSACTTRIKTGCGVPQLGAVMEIAEHFKTYINRPVLICDGGMKTPGDIAKALAAGADCVMLGGMLAGTDETPGEVLYEDTGNDRFTLFNKKDWLSIVDQYRASGVKAIEVREYKSYRGSASKESYKDQGKDTKHRTSEGESFVVKYKGPVADILQDIAGGLRSAFAYVGAKNVEDFQKRAEFIEITSAGSAESSAHGKASVL